MVTGTRLVPRFTRPSTSLVPAKTSKTRAKSGGLLPSAAAVISLTDIECISGINGASLSRRTSAAGVSSTSPHCRTRTHVRLSHPIRSASAPIGRTATAPSVFVDNTTAFHSNVGSGEARGKNLAAVPAGLAATEKGRLKVARSVSATPPCTSASSATHAAGPAVSARPLLRPHLPSHRGEGPSEHTQAPVANSAGNPAATHIRLTTFTRRVASVTQKKRPQSPSAARTAQFSTLNPAAIASSDASRARPGTVSGVSAGASVGAAAGVQASASRPTRTFPCDSCDVEGTGSSDADTSPVVPVPRSPYLTRPSLPPPRSVRHRYSLRASPASLKNSSSAFFPHHEEHCPPGEEVTATGHLFCSTPNLSAPTENAGRAPRCSSRDEGFMRSASISGLEGPGNTQSSDSNATCTAACETRQGGGCTCGRETDPRRQAATNSASPPLSPNTSEADIHAVGSAGVIARFKEVGNTFLLREEFGSAIEAYTKAIRLDPTQEALWSNRACAFLLTFRYLSAVADCLYLLHLHPGHTNACWRAAKAYASAYRLLEAKKYYQLAQQACEREGMSERLTPIGGRMPPSCSMPACGVDDKTHGAIASGIVESTAPMTVEASCRCDSRFAKAQRDCQAITAEVVALGLVEVYWKHLRDERWGDALEAMDKVLASPCYTGPTAVSWRALRLEALLHLQPKKALAEAEALHRAYPDSLELYPVLVKAIFYDMHDAAATNRCLGLLDEASKKRRAQNRLLKEQVRYCATRLYEGGSTDRGKATFLQIEAWGKQCQLKEDSRTAELRHTIEKFVRYRDIGNAAYEAGDWDAAAAAYTRCLETDRLNNALLAAVYCNRTAVYMQEGRWQDALDDAGSALSFNPQHATAYARRGRVQLYLLAHEYNRQRVILASRYTAQWKAAMKQRLQRYADAAVADLTRAVKLLPTVGHKTQLQQALAQRQAIQTTLESARETSKGPKPSSGAPSSEGAGPFGQSAYSSPPHTAAQGIQSAAMREIVGQLNLLGLSIVEPSACGELGILPEPRVIAKAYRNAALRWHPDKWVTATPNEQQHAERQFKSICIAYQALREYTATALEEGTRKATSRT
ncbi:hypothetical protein JKF63_00070 [Porcisia hertigi]|uniref:J domain-containing protein n=1 Tax=Porcisia hertigi TaxID=2761500 RepID=A0A836KY03_9TRYP|nr:hypothetical protein JKF63_00070 [Porcisia hertigi]